MKKLMMVVMAMGMAAAAWADVSFSYSGQLRSETGGAVGVKNPTITFSLYNAATQGTVLWSRMVPVQLDDNGYFAVELSNAVGSPVVEAKLEEVLANNANLYIGLNVKDSSGEISPRQKLLSTPRAAFAEDVKTAKDGFTVNGAAVFMNGLQIGSGTGIKAEIKEDGTINAKNIQLSGHDLLPKRVIVMWCGSVEEIPDGWALCDGSEHDGVKTPDLRGKFIVGYDSGDADYNAINKTGGVKKVTLTESNLPSHRHQYFSYGTIYENRNDSAWVSSKSVNDTPASTCPDLLKVAPALKLYQYSGPPSYSSGNLNYEVLSTGQGAGTAKELDSRPTYYTLAYIMKL